MTLPMPMLNEKKACPNALNMTAGVIFEKSGVNIKCCAAVKSPTAMLYPNSTKSMIKRAGIKMLLAFSKPALTPRATTPMVIHINTVCHIMRVSGEAKS